MDYFTRDNLKDDGRQTGDKSLLEFVSEGQKRIRIHSLLDSQRLQECAKICVKKCKRAKNWKIDFADVCIFFF